MRALLLIATLSCPGLAMAACPAVDPGLAIKATPLFESLKLSKTQDTGAAVASKLWALFGTAPDAQAQDLLDKGKQSIQWGAFDEAEATLNDLVDYCPDYAEGWNQRAFARFLKNDFDAALSDLDRALELEPRHFGAMAGRGLTLLRQGRQVLGLQAIREAVKVHPWINERHLLPPEERT